MIGLRKSIYVLGTIFAGIGMTRADIVYYDYSPITASVAPQENGGEVSDTLYLSTNGIDLNSGELQINVSGQIVKSNNSSSWSAIVELGTQIITATSNEVLSVSTLFNTDPETLIEQTTKNSSSPYDGYIGLEFSALDGKSFFGWAEISATTSIDTHGKIGLASITVLRMAYNNVADGSIVVGAIPEPAVATLIIFFGSSLLAGRRIFMK